MDNIVSTSRQHSYCPRLAPSAPGMVGLIIVSCFLSGCAAVSNPVANGIPVRLLPPELLTQPREDMQTVPLTALRQRPPDAYHLAPGDVLGIWIDTVTGPEGVPPPIIPVTGGRPPAVGLPIPVRLDGTLFLPQINPIKVEGMTILQAEEAIREAYRKSKILEDKARIIVTLARPRQYHILVIRQDSGGLTVTGTGLIGNTKRGSGAAIDLPAYENDVLNALAVTGGFPGLDAVNEVVIERGAFNPDQDPSTLLEGYTFAPPGCNILGGAGRGGQFTRIPIRIHPGEQLPFQPEDVVLNSGDIVFIEERTTETWYSGGLLPPAEHILPRDRDLDVLQAIVQGGFELISPGVSTGNLSGTIIAAGMGTPIPSLLSVIRRTPNGQQVVIKVDANKALRDPRERLLIQAGDIVILQETPAEAFTRYIIQKFDVTISWMFIHGPHESGTAVSNVPFP